MTPDEQAHYERIRTLHQRRQRSVNEAAADSWHQAHQQPYQVAERAVGQSDAALDRAQGRQP